MRHPLERIVSWLAARRKRTVMLYMFDHDIKIVRAYKTQAGWIARWIGNDDAWSLLLPEGKTEGCTLVKRWLPHSGWKPGDFAS